MHDHPFSTAMDMPQNGTYENENFRLKTVKKRLILATGSSKIDSGKEIGAVRDGLH
jgi:hypothetical protein